MLHSYLYHYTTSICSCCHPYYSSLRPVPFFLIVFPTPSYYAVQISWHYPRFYRSFETFFCNLFVFSQKSQRLLACATFSRFFCHLFVIVARFTIGSALPFVQLLSSHCPKRLFGTMCICVLRVSPSNFARTKSLMYNMLSS